MNSTTITNIRLGNFRKLCEDYRFSKEISDKIGKSESYVSQIRSGTKPIGSLVAREIEKAFGLQEGYMDVKHSDFLKATVIDNDVELLASVIQSLPPNIRDHFKRLTFAVASELAYQKEVKEMQDDANRENQ